jgi:MraZ protein
MTQFLGTFTGRLDGKGRASIPALFRHELRQAGDTAALILRPSHKYDCIEGWTRNAFDQLAGPMQRLDLFSDEEDDMAYALYADALPCEPDKEGRFVLPEALARHANLTDALTFVGLRNRFEIWEPEAFRRHHADKIARARSRGLGLSQVPA